MDKLSYAVGLSIGQQILKSGIEIFDFQSFTKGVETVYKDLTPEVDVYECQNILNEYFEKKEAEMLSQTDEHKKAGENFLRENAKRPEIKTTKSGLQYEILKEGNGKTPTASDIVRVHYHGTLIDGKVFDSSVKRGIPAEFGVNQVIKGWVEALQLMKVGSKYKLYIPSELGYGKQSAGITIKPNSVLIFEVELLSIK